MSSLLNSNVFGRAKKPVEIRRRRQYKYIEEETCDYNNRTVRELRVAKTRRERKHDDDNCWLRRRQQIRLEARATSVVIRSTEKCS